MISNNRTHAYVPVLISLCLAAVHCGGDDLECGPGAKKYGDRCVAEISDCAPGTELVDGKCEPVCAENESWNGSKCVADTACAPGTELVDGECVPACEDGSYWDGQTCSVLPSCAEGTTFDEDAGACVPDESLCAEGTHFDGGVCVPDTESCGPGTHLDGGTCVPDALPDPDVVESSTPDGVADFDLPGSGGTVSLGGTVDTPADGDGDGYTDPDYDRFSFSAQAGTWLRIHGTSEGAAHPAFVVVSDATDADGAPLFVRYAVNPGGVDTQREVYLPFDGDYRLIVSDYGHVTGDLFGWLALPVGGDDFTYYVTVENLGTPTPSPVSSVPAAEAGDLTGGALAFFELTGLAQHDVRVVRHLGMPEGKMNNDVFGALMLFGPDGTLLRQNLALATDADATVLFAATTDGDHLVVVDHLLTIGTNLDYEWRAEEVASVDCGASDCSSGSVGEDVSRLLSWDLVEGTVFVAGAYVPDTATSTLRVQMMDEGLSPIGDPASASKYGPAKLRRFAASDQRLYLLLRGSGGDEVPAYTLDVRTPLADLLTSGNTHSGLPVIGMPADTYPEAGVCRFVADAGQVLVATGFSTASSAWTDPVETFVSTTFDVTPPALDVTDPAFPNSALAPLLAYAPEAGYGLYQVTDGAGADIGAATYDVAFHALEPSGLGTPAPGTPVGETSQALDAAAALAVFGFDGAESQQVTVTVTPESGAQLEPEVWVATPGYRQYVSGSHEWVSDANGWALGVLARGAATAAGESVTVPITLPYDGVHLVIVRDIGAGAPTDAFDVEVASN